MLKPSLVPCSDEQRAILMAVYHEGSAFATARQFPASPDEVICKSSDCPYPVKSLEEMAFMLGYLSTTLGKLAAHVFHKPPTEPSRN